MTTTPATVRDISIRVAGTIPKSHIYHTATLSEYSATTMAACECMLTAVSGTEAQVTRLLQRKHRKFVTIPESNK